MHRAETSLHARYRLEGSRQGFVEIPEAQTLDGLYHAPDTVSCDQNDQLRTVFGNRILSL